MALMNIQGGSDLLKTGDINQALDQSASVKKELKNFALKDDSTTDTQGFIDILKDGIDKVNNLQKKADVEAQKLAVGEGNVHEAMIAMEKADISFKTLVAVRNKVLEAYREMMRMNV